MGADTLTTERPGPHWLSAEDVQRGYWWEAVPANEATQRGWTTERPTLRSGQPASDKCRQRIGVHSACRKPAVAWLNRAHLSSHPSWWAYCPRHLYGRWFEDGVMMMWRLVTDRPKEG